MQPVTYSGLNPLSISSSLPMDDILSETRPGQYGVVLLENMPDPQLDIADFLVFSVVISVFAGLAAEYFIGPSIENRPTF